MTTPRVYGGLRADERTARRREQLLAAGLEVFADRGWSAATVQDVCRAAGLSPRYFYEEFAGREELFVAVTGRVAEQVHATVRAALAVPAEQPEQRVRAVLAALADALTADPRVVRVALVESMATPALREHRRALLADLTALTARLMRSLRDGTGGRRLTTSAAVLTGGVVELLLARDGDGPVPASVLDHLTDLYAAAARL